ncbi:hypothetical protein MBM_02785 [Drepanopeziza brunnea f. sp. 'multigermtubi' MB_m1]|uniref:Uncharacterized protein n=2 Tax=Drepanopeziza brunnea f. sp. 'multigermtubi' TaxID=698441 RepID=K1XFB7_MARBU|nr:uncharacterized protein MBM_02785 [Drepanopeziza brunnea f. sp. 'multigermtubi' MB_m1]EKD19548.1 hypothetical protein MBM_02785 [Drepanopeziza brunnea f. sp. 'multigermtubi' MB_m1]
MLAEMDESASHRDTRPRGCSLYQSMQIGRAITTSSRSTSNTDELFKDLPTAVETAQLPLPPFSKTHKSNNNSQHSLPYSRRFSDSQELLPGQSRKSLYHYSSTTKFVFDKPVTERRSAGGLKALMLGNGREKDPDWGGVPQTLTRGLKDGFRDLMVDVLGVVATFPFFVLGGVLAYQNGEELEPSKRHVLEQCIMGAATLFPLVFSVIVGRTMIKFASWRLEKGAELGLLERLVGSRTVGGTIITQLRLRSISIVGLGLILVWLLSPLGSQSVLRILSTSTKPIVSTDFQISYLNLRQASQASTPAFNEWFSSFAAMFTSAMLAPHAAKNSTMDPWGNVRIPLFSSLPRNSSDTNGWRQVSNNITPVYTSLFGIPVSGLPLGNSTFTIESSYTELTCSNRTSTLVRGADFFIDPGLISATGPFYSFQIVSDTTTWVMGYAGDDVTSLLPNATVQSLDSLPSDTTLQTFSPGFLLYQDFTGTANVTSLYCIPSQAYVESIVICSKSSLTTSATCAVTAQRNSVLAHMPTALTPFSLNATWLAITALLPFTTPSGNNIDLIQNYLVNPNSNPYIESTPIVSASSLANDNKNNTSESRFLNQVTLPEFSHRLTQILNTFLQGTLPSSPSYLKGDQQLSPLASESPSASASASKSPPATPPPASLSAQLSNAPATLTVPSTHTTTSLQPTLTTSYTWLALYLLSTLATLLCALAAALIRRQCRARDSLPYVSSLCREVLQPGGGGAALDGLERSRRCQGQRVRLGDLGQVPGRGVEVGTGVRLPVGRLGIGPCDGRVGGLVRGKLYL